MAAGPIFQPGQFQSIVCPYLGGQQRRLSRLLLSPTKAKKMVVAQKRKKKVEKTMNIATAMQSTPDMTILC